MTMTNDRERTAAGEEYNGWPNRETWAASLHLSNDFGLYEMVNGWAEDARREAIEEAGEDRLGFYADGVATVELATVRNLADKLQDYIETLRADISEHAERIGSSAFPTREEVAMVLEIGSEWRVDWRHLAENWLEGFDFEADDR